jgi:hypothetical protein
MPTEQQINEALQSLHSQLALPEDKEQDFFKRAVNLDYWKGLASAMGLLDMRSLDHLEGGAYSSEQEEWALGHLKRHGYFRMLPLVAPDITARMCSAVEMLRKAGWPAIFTYVYDEFWAAWRAPSVVRLLSRCLGGGYLQTSGVWTYRVDPMQRGSGWPPHVDSEDDAERLTVWIPLTEATTDNGCMYVIPQDRVPPNLPANYRDWTSISAQELSRLLHSVTPLPAVAGSVLGWNNRLIHWGGGSTELAAGPRISVAAEFLREGTRPHGSQLPVLDVSLPDFPTRLRVIGQAILSYEKFEPLMRRYRSLAEKLIE